MKKEGTENVIRCKKCDYVWPTRSKLGLVSCPNCGAKNTLFHDNLREEIIKIQHNVNSEGMEYAWSRGILFP